MMHFPRGFLVCGLGCALGLAACSSDSSSGGGASGGSTGGAAGSSGAGAGGTGGSSAGTSGSGGAGVGGNAGSAGGGGAAGSAGSGGATTAICVPNASYGSPLPADKSAKLVAGGYHFLEGPVWSTELSALFFSDMNFGASDSQGVPPSIVYRLAAGSSSPEIFIDTIGCNGNAIDQNGFLVSCTHDTRSVSRIDPVTKQRTPIADKFEGKAFNSPNDAIVRSDGTIYFTDPSWQLGSRPAEIGFKGVYRIDPQGNVTLVSQSLVSPNGAALSPDEKLLYVADDNTGNVHRFDMREGPIVIGRHEACQLVVTSPRMSRLHACVYAHRGRIWIADLQSQNGTQYQGRVLTAAVPVPIRADGEGAPIRLYDQDLEIRAVES